MPFLSFSQKELDPLDLASLDPSVVTDVRRFDIPCGFQQTYNPSWTHFEGQRVTAVRCDNYGRTPNSTTIGIYEGASTPHWLTLPQPMPEDPRLIVYRDRLWLFFNGRAKEAHMKIFICPLEKRLGRWGPSEPPVQLVWPEGPASRTEKNWMPIIQGERLYFVYSLRPYILLEADVKTGLCTQVKVPSPNFSWSLGEPRGSTQMLPHEDGGYVGIFHSSKRTTPLTFRPRTKVYYFVGGMKIDENLHLTHISKAAYDIPGYYGRGTSGRVVFPCGMLDLGDRYELCAGRNDHYSIAITLDKAAFMKNLKPVALH